MRVPQAIMRKLMGDGSIELDERIERFLKVRLWALSTKYPLQKLRELKMGAHNSKVSLREGTVVRAIYRAKHEGREKSDMIGFQNQRMYA